MGKLIFNKCGCSFKTLNRPDNEVLRVDSYTSDCPKLDIDIYSVPLICNETWKSICDGKVKGLFQLEGYLGKIWSKKLLPHNIGELSDLIALIRPGCIKSYSGNPPKSMTQRYCDRKNGLEQEEPIHKALGPLLQSTHQVMTYQEQAMLIAKEIAGFTLQQADELRKGIGKKLPKIIAKLKNEFIDGCKKIGKVNEEEAQQIFDWIRESQKYLFNLSHSISYSKDAYWSAYLKTHFPLQFYCAYLSGAEWKMNTQEEIAELVNDAKLANINICIPDLRKKNVKFIIDNNNLYFGLGEIKQIGNAAIKKILKGIFDVEALLKKSISELSWIEYILYLSNRMSTTNNLALMHSGALDFLGKPRLKMIYDYKIWQKLSNLEVAHIIEREKQGCKFYELSDCILSCIQNNIPHGEKRKKIVNDLFNMLTKPPHELYDNAESIAWMEEYYLGAAITCNKVDGSIGASSANAICKDVVKGKSGYIVLAVEVNKFKEIITKKDKSKMAFVTMSDNSCVLDDVVCFPMEWAQYKDIIVPGNTLLISGERNSKSNSFILKKAQQI